MKKEIKKTGILAAGVLAIGSVTTADAASLFTYSDLGSGADVRTDLSTKNSGF